MHIPSRYQIKTNDPDAKVGGNVLSLDASQEEALVERIVEEVIRRLEARGVLASTAQQEGEEYFPVRKNAEQRPMSEY